jgi:hypothetical protein
MVRDVFRAQKLSRYHIDKIDAQTHANHVMSG